MEVLLQSYLLIFCLCSRT